MKSYKNIFIVSCMLCSVYAHSSWGSMLSSVFKVASNNKAVIALGYASALMAAHTLTTGFTTYKIIRQKVTANNFYSTWEADIKKIAGQGSLLKTLVTGSISAALAYTAICRGRSS